jgi:hypothetical protein
MFFFFVFEIACRLLLQECRPCVSACVHVASAQRYMERCNVNFADHAILSLCIYLILRITANMRDLSSEDRRKMLFGSDILVP